MEKSADAFRTISEVADDLSLPQHVLRFWETRFPQIRPLKRAGGRRYYRPADVHLLRTIRQLLYDDGYTIKGVQRLIKEQGARGLATVPRDEIAALLELEAEVDEQDLAEAGRTTTAMPIEPTATAAAGLVDVGDLAQAGLANPDVAHGDLAQALAEIDACVRILEALHRP